MDPRTLLLLTRRVMVGVWVVVGVFCLGVTVARLAQGRWRDAAIVSVFSVAAFVVAALSAWWFRRQRERPAWTRTIPDDVWTDPQQRSDAVRSNWRVSIWPWAMLLGGLAGSVWAVMMGRWPLLFWCALMLIAGLRLMRPGNVQRPKPRP